jgi:sulfate transport system ATP-binding protein
MSIRIEHISKRYGSFTALSDVSLTIESGELVALLGPSGSGKTTLLRIIAGLESPDEGSILLHGEESTRHSASRRGIGFVFQHYALFRHMTIFENVAFGLRVQSRLLRPSRPNIRERVRELLHLVQLDSFAEMYPEQLSGGQRQRVALARALAVKPRVLLLDEPFSALDAKVRKELRDWLRRIHDDLHVTTVLVTHDQEEALEVADRVAILNRGELEQTGTRPPRSSITSWGMSISSTGVYWQNSRLRSVREAHRNPFILQSDLFVRTSWSYRAVFPLTGGPL